MEDRTDAAEAASKTPRLTVPAARAEPSPTDLIIEEMFVARINNSVVSRNTEIFNYVRGWVDDLKLRLAKES